VPCAEGGSINLWSLKGPQDCSGPAYHQNPSPSAEHDPPTVCLYPITADFILLAFFMKVSALSFGSFALTLLSSGLVHSFPTAENFAKLARSNALENGGVGSEDLHESLLRLKQKRLFFDPMTTPIDGMFFLLQDTMNMSLTSTSNWKTCIRSSWPWRSTRTLPRTFKFGKSWLYFSRWCCRGMSPLYTSVASMIADWRLVLRGDQCCQSR
jgi:hypothetical protein